jgi:hypothetical protein
MDRPKPLLRDLLRRWYTGSSHLYCFSLHERNVKYYLWCLFGGSRPGWVFAPTRPREWVDLSGLTSTHVSAGLNGPIGRKLEARGNQPRKAELPLVLAGEFERL